MKLPRSNRRDRIVVNLKLFAIKAYIFVIRPLPCKKPLVEAIGTALGLLSMCRHIGQWKRIGKFASQFCSGSGRPAFVIRYFVQRGKDLAWEMSGYEEPLDPAQYAEIEGGELLSKSLVAGKGAILLGAHYGPALALHTLHRMSVEARVLVDPWRKLYWESFSTLGSARLQRKMFPFAQENSIAAGKGEKALISHLRSGGVILIEIDSPGPRRREPEVSFLGQDIPPHYFPFEISLKYRAPVFFCLFERNGANPYRFRIVPCNDFSSAREGLEKYIAFFEDRILSYPFMWSFVPHFFGMFVRALGDAGGAADV